jgi:hypothetical protein
MTGQSPSMPRDLLPELALWDRGKPIALEDWLRDTGGSDVAMGWSALLWPAFETVGDMVFRAPFDHQRLTGWSRMTHSRHDVEHALNRFDLTQFFAAGPEPVPIAHERRLALARTMVEMLQLKLARDVPERQFAVALIDAGPETGVTFYQI